MREILISRKCLNAWRRARGWSSRRFDVAYRRDLAQLGAHFVLSAFEIILGLHAHPERRRGAKIPSESQRRIGGYGGLLVGQSLDTRARHADCAADRVRRAVHGAKEVLAQDLARMHGKKSLGHGGTLFKIIDDLGLFGFP